MNEPIYGLTPHMGYNEAYNTPTFSSMWKWLKSLF